MMLDAGTRRLMCSVRPFQAQLEPPIADRKHRSMDDEECITMP